jgi:hypothetical protein
MKTPQILAHTTLLTLVCLTAQSAPQNFSRISKSLIR